VVIELARELGIPFVDRPFHLADLPRLEEFFLTGTTTDVMPVVEIDGKAVADGRPGPLTRRLYDAMAGRLYATVGAGR